MCVPFGFMSKSIRLRKKSVFYHFMEPSSQRVFVVSVSSPVTTNFPVADISIEDIPWPTVFEL